MNMHNCSLVPKTIFKLKINVFFSLGGRKKSICPTTTGCVCLFKFSNLHNQFTNEYISITPVNSHVFLMQESVLFGLSLFFFSPKKTYHMKKNVWALWEWMIFKLWGHYGLMYPRKSTRCWRPVSTVTAAEQCWKQFKSFCPPAHTVFSNISGSLIKIWRGTDSASLVLTGEWALV